ncbi:hypothetical protein ABZ782_28270 [Streptomyces asoensis]|uniref:DUF6907 domain-containing protein n=1 Tax=Streptomyces asoensis TaxID=249586 RepID=UPI0034028A7D
MTEPRTVTLPTLDHGDVTLPEPSWCRGHADHRPDSYRVDLDHKGPAHELRHDGEVLWTAFLGQAPFATDPARRGTDLYVEQGSYAHSLDGPSLYDLAATLDTHADRLRDLADQLDRIREEAGREA